jgi:alanine racemase
MSAPERLATVDLGAISANVERLREFAATPHLMAVVKANGYGHGAVPAARAALAGGADRLGVADLDEALALRAAGITAPILAWLHDVDADFAPAFAAGIEIGVSSPEQLGLVAATAPGASVQLKVDTGLSRNGIAPDRWDETFALAAALQAAGRVSVVGLFSHLANASDADDAAAESVFADALARARAAGLDPEFVHLASTAAAIRHDQGASTMVRVGIGIYGLSPFGDGDSERLGLRPAMTLSSRVAAVRRVPAGAGVSYDYVWRAPAPTNLALVPLGYADGVPRAASDRASVQIGGALYPVRGRIAMDQFVVDLGDASVPVGERVVLFGDPASGAPGAADWARWADTIDYEIVTRIGHRVRREYV